MQPAPGPDSVRWKRVRGLFEAARFLNPDEQISYIRRECGPDEALAEEVLSLLRPATVPPNSNATQRMLPFALGQIVAERFRILRPVGRGGMGEVYEAEDLRLNERVALKTIRPEVALDPSVVERFKREVLLAKRMTHPNICRIHDLGVHRPTQETEVFFLTMAFLEGETLASRLGRGAMTEEEALPLIVRMCDALSAAHEAGVVHRDFKSSNVMLVQRAGRPQAIITDFGLAVAQEGRNLEESLTKENAIVGTVAYMAPEQVQGKKADARADIYALGIVMYEMVTGRCPFIGDSALGVALQQVNDEPAPPSTYARELDKHWEGVILRCLRKKPEHRFSSAAAVKNALNGASSAPGFSLRSHPKLALATLGLTLVVLLMVGLLVTVPPSWLKWLWGGLPSEKRVAVLEFQNVGGDPRNAAFCEGLMEVFANQLTNLEQFQGSLAVVPASDVRKEKVRSARDARREFDANLVITGSVQRNSDGTHLIVNIVDATKLKQLRSRAIFVPQEDVIAMQDGVVKEVADLLDVELRPEAQHHLAEGNTIVPGAYDFYLQGAGYLSERDGADQAVAEFRRALELDPSYALAHAGLGRAYWWKYSETKNRDWVDRAWRECEQAVKLNPRLGATHAALAILNSGTGNYEEAVQQARVAIQSDPQDYHAYAVLAGALDALSRTNEAESTLKKAISLKPSYWNSYVGLGTFYFDHGRYKDAEAAYRRVTELVPDNPTGYTDLGVIYHLENREDEAIRILKKSLEIRPTMQAYSNLATTYFFLGRYSDAIPIMQKLVEKSNDPTVWGNLGDAYRWTAGNENKASPIYRKALELAREELRVNPKDKDAVTDIALYEAKLGQPAHAVDAIKKALAIAPTDSNVLFYAAIVFELADKRDAAINYLKLAIQNGYSINEIAGEPELHGLRQDARYSALLMPGTGYPTKSQPMSKGAASHE